MALGLMSWLGLALQLFWVKKKLDANMSELGALKLGP